MQGCVSGDTKCMPITMPLTHSKHTHRRASPWIQNTLYIHATSIAERSCHTLNWTGAGELCLSVCLSVCSDPTQTDTLFFNLFPLRLSQVYSPRSLRLSVRQSTTCLSVCGGRPPSELYHKVCPHQRCPRLWKKKK